MHTNHDLEAQIRGITCWQSGLKLFAVISAGLLSACVSSTPNYDKHFGEATRATFKQQIINPDAGNNTDPVAGIDGKAANEAIKNYQESFDKPERAQDTFNIGVGDSSGQ